MKTLPILVIMCCTFCVAQNNFTFPFEDGNKWFYDLYSAFSEFPISRTTFQIGRDTLMPNHQTYRFFISFYLRQDGSKIYQYLPFDSSEFIRYDFAKQVGDTVSIVKQGSFSYAILLTGDHNMPVIDRMRRVLNFNGGPIGDAVADSIGIIGLAIGTDNWYQLVGAIISGHSYGIVTSIKRINEAIPQTPDLSQNYPNPFNPSTLIRYEVHQALNVKITINNEIGQQIATLVDSYKLPGSYQIAWNASNYSSGVYYCTMNCGSFLKTTKLVLLK